LKNLKDLGDASAARLQKHLFLTSILPSASAQLEIHGNTRSSTEILRDASRLEFDPVLQRWKDLSALPSWRWVGTSRKSTYLYISVTTTVIPH